MWNGFFSRSVLLSWKPLVVLAAISCGGIFPPAVRADNGGQVQFDVGNIVACRDVTPPEFYAVNPGERVLEARIQISVLSLTSPGHDIAELLLKIESPERTLQIADYFPKTTLTTDFVGPVNVERQSEQTKSLEFNMNAQTVTANAHAAGNQQAHERYTAQGQQLPPLELCAASGTILRGHGVYFKLCPTPRTSLEGSHDLILRFQVPASWRADYLLVNCEASGVSNNFLGAGGARVRRGAKSFIVATHLEGDMVAKSRATGLIRAERELRYVASAYQGQLKKNTNPDPLREIGSLIKGVDRRIPENWLEQVLFGSPANPNSFDEKLPSDVRLASLNYRDAKRQVQRANAPTKLTAAKNIERLPPVAN